jgi:hypothetical protein
VAGSSTERPVSSGDAPHLSIVVVSFNSERRLIACLEAIASEAGSPATETIVVRACRPGTGTFPSSVRTAWPCARYVEAPAGCTVPRMRALGIAESRGAIVALIEDDCLVQRGWAEAVVSAHRGPEAAVGGAVEPGPYANGLDWSVYFCDYGRFMLPLAAGPAAALPGNNMSYKRTALASLPAQIADEFQEVFVHQAWRQAGVPMRTDPAVVVVNTNAWRWSDVTRTPFHHARAYAAARLAGRPFVRRAVMSLLALPLPLVKVLRVSREPLHRRRLVAPLLRSLPWVCVLSASWSLGESVGYLFGPGRSASEWR